MRVNLSVKAAGTDAAHRLTSWAPTQWGSRHWKRTGTRGTTYDKNGVKCLPSLTLWGRLEKQSTHPAYFRLFLNKDLKILINNGDSKQDPSAGANGPQEVGQHRQGTDAQASECSRGGDVPRRQKRSGSGGTGTW